ncbi:hypothetical protein Tco_1305512 [Tanacetum coccineum]
MSDSEHSTVTYTLIFSDYEEPSDAGSSGVVVYRYEGLPMHPPSPDYVPGPKHPPSPDYLPGPEHPPSHVYVPYVLEPVYPKFMPPEDDVFPAVEQPLLAAVSPTADLLGYITEFDPEEDPEEDDEDSEEDPADYPADKDEEEEEEESSKDDVDDEEEEEDEDEEEQEHLASADFILPLAYRTTARMSTISIPSPPLPVSSPLPMSPPPLLASPTHPLGYRAVMIRLRAESPSTSHLLLLPPPIVLLRTRASMVMMRDVAPSTYILAPRSVTPPSGTPPLLPIPLPTSSPPCFCPLLTVERMFLRGFRADYGFVGTLDAEIRHDLDREVGYGFTNTWDEMVKAMQEIAPTTLEGVNQRVTDLVTTVRQETNEIYGRLDDA